MRWGRRHRPVAVLAVGAIVMVVASPPTRAGPGAVDYFQARFEARRVLDRGDRPNWSPDGMRLAFTESDTEDSFAYELELATGAVRCLTCRWGPGGLVTRIYHLLDGSYLVEAAPGRESGSPNGAGGGPAGLLTTELYWMPASAATPPQRLDVPASGEVAISSRTAVGGGFLIAWSSPFTLGQIMTGELVHDGSRATVTNRRAIPMQPPQVEGPLGRYGEPYDFARNDEALVFWGFAAPLDGEMFEVDVETGAVQRLYRDPSHNETHLFPDERFGLEESNRASDPDGTLRGVSGLAADAPVGGPFDLFVVALEDPAQVRRLTNVSDLGGQANQSVPAPDGRRIAFVLDAPASGPYAGEGGLYVGEFLIDR